MLMTPQSSAPAAASPPIRLTDLRIGASARVVSVGAADPGAPAELGRRLAELGFLPGEAVRIGTSTFALRLFEAACIRVCPEHPLPARWRL
jgi:Fe2+ transport system protein FeoA